MSITTKSKWYYGFFFDSSNKYLNIDEGSGEETITVTGDYTAEEFAEKLSDTLNQDLTLTYTVAFNRTTRLFTISATGTFDILSLTGSNASQSMCSVIGFATDEDKVDANTYTSDVVAGFSYEPQFYLQKYISFEDSEESVTSTVNISADGSSVEVIDYGTQYFMECQIMFANDSRTTSSEITTSATGVADLRSFLSYSRRKRRLEFMPDEATPSSYYNCILESTEASSSGTAFKLKEMYAKGMVGFYESGSLKFRKVG